MCGMGLIRSILLTENSLLSLQKTSVLSHPVEGLKCPVARLELLVGTEPVYNTLEKE